MSRKRGKPSGNGNRKQRTAMILLAALLVLSVIAGAAAAYNYSKWNTLFQPGAGSLPGNLAEESADLAERAAEEGIVLLKNQENRKLSALLTLEEGEVCLGEIKKLEEFYSYGARMMTLTWNYDNSLSTANANKTPWKRNYSGNREGLTETGIEFVERMEELGMIPDVSHMSDEGIEDMLQVAKKPFVASHSNARSLCNHPRNLTDDFLKRMGEKGCVIGTNFASAFLKEGTDYSKNEWIADHILYMVNAAGIESVGFGTDFDGIECGLEIKDCSNMQILANLLKMRGMSETDVERVFYKNVLRLYKELL